MLYEVITILIQAASIVYPSFDWGQKAINNTLIILIIGFPMWIVFAYVFEWTPKGFKKTNDIPNDTSIRITSYNVCYTKLLRPRNIMKLV